MTPEELRHQRIRAFRQLAQEEFEVALEIKVKHRRQAAYFLQQSVEKLLRGVLEVAGIPAGPMHNIRALAELLGKDHVLFETFVELDELSPAATRFRYPSPKGTVADFDETKFDALVPKIEALMKEAGTLMDDCLAGH
ncbi:HEPN domain-containing protein [Rhizobium sp. SG2393]|uniref:HEPN domain-containing protein n=1 Tax=Rhizobium sp. SG2393 TaxID=3276279 RepID=UPI00366D73E7